ncbi:MAG: DUF4878 domain-containing protein [Betaproteobacteria bacterium]|nr:DUF4878 domain-containing protein [Betaproteobacteria bacterium]
MSEFFSTAGRKLTTLLGTFFVFALLAACSSQSPESVAGDYMKAAANNRVEEAIGYFALGDIKENDLTAVKGKLQMIVGQQYSVIQDNGGLDSVSTNLVEKNEDGTSATVMVETKFKNGQSKKDRMTLIQESGKWKIRLK